MLTRNNGITGKDRDNNSITATTHHGPLRQFISCCSSTVVSLSRCHTRMRRRFAPWRDRSRTARIVSMSRSARTSATRSSSRTADLWRRSTVSRSPTPTAAWSPRRSVGRCTTSSSLTPAPLRTWRCVRTR